MTVAGPAVVSPPVVVIDGRGRGALGEVAAVWAHRELLGFLAWKEFKIRYTQTVLGVAWAVLQPVATTLVFAIFFGRLVRLPSDGVPYPLFAYTGLLLWTMVAQAVLAASESLVANRSLVTKVYFPRLIVPLAPLFVSLVDFGAALVVLVLLMVFYGVAPGPMVVAAPVFVLLALVLAAAIGSWLAALNVRYRDVRHTVPFLMQLWLFATPVAYPSSLLAEPWRTLYGLNPMVGVVEGFRWALVGGRAAAGPLLVSAVTIVVLLGAGLWYFARVERAMADVV